MPMKIPSLSRFCDSSKRVTVYLAGCFVLTTLTIIVSLAGATSQTASLRGVAAIIDAPRILLPSQAGEPASSSPPQSQDPESIFEKQSLAAPICLPIQDPNDVDFTFVTQLSLNRLWLMEEHCKQWGRNHPISIAVSGNLPRTAVLRTLETMGCNLEMIHVEVVPITNKEEAYPVNKLRNLAFSKIQTTHAVYVDADFLLSSNIYEDLQQHREALSQDDKMALVLPAFELRKFCSDNAAACHKLHLSALPRTKSEVLEIASYHQGNGTPSSSTSTSLSAVTSEATNTATAPFASGSPNLLVAQFDSKGNPSGHGSTDYKHWMTQDSSELFKIPCITSPRYEPYLVIRYCQDMPPFQEVFSGYGMNKLTWTQHVRHVGYQFYQVGGSFVTHFPHSMSSSWKKWDKERHGKERRPTAVDNLALQMKAWLESEVPTSPNTTLYCEESAIASTQ